ncbi:MAG: hypothetical protein WAV41_04445 [Microgenomates group bacterium]
MKKIIFSIIFTLNIFFVFYLITPLPQIPDLANSQKSDLPGDTTQQKNISGYFTNLSRTEVITFYKANLNGPFRIQLNHPPEKSKQIIGDTTQSYYLEEFVFPFKGSVFINGFDWQKDVFTRPEKRIANKLYYHDVEYQSKITVKSFPTSLLQRIIFFVLGETILFLIYFSYRKFVIMRHE